LEISKLVALAAVCNQKKLNQSKGCAGLYAVVFRDAGNRQLCGLNRRLRRPLHCHPLAARDCDKKHRRQKTVARSELG